MGSYRLIEREIRWGSPPTNKERTEFDEANVPFLNEFLKKFFLPETFKRPLDGLWVHDELGSQVVATDVHNAGAGISEDQELEEHGEIGRVECVEGSGELSFTHMDDGKHMRNLEMVSSV